MKLHDLKSYQACILQICQPDSEPYTNALPYALFLNDCSVITDWIITGEKNEDGIFHVHALLKTNSRTDATTRSLNSTWRHLHTRDNFLLQFTAQSSLDILKIQRCHRPSSLLAYMMKNPDWICSNCDHLLQLAFDLDCWDFPERFRKQTTDTETPEMNEVTRLLLDTIREQNCKSVEDVMRAAPTQIVKYLHKPGFVQTIQNCLTFTKSTGETWNIQLFAKHDPACEAIHQILLFQGIRPTIFDTAIHALLTKKDSKKNCLCLIGPSNSGKSAFFHGLKQIISWGEIVNHPTFAFEALPGNYAGFWEEPLLSAELAEKFKQVAEGMPCQIPVKYRKPQFLPRTPLIITTNHPLWRFCSTEQPMLENRMWIFEFNHSPTNTTYLSRIAEPSCQCTFCQASTGCESHHGSTSSTRLQRTKQSLRAIRSSQKPDVGHRPLCERGTSTSRSDNSRSDLCEPSTSFGTTESHRSSICSSPTIERYFRKRRARSCSPDDRVHHTFEQSHQHVEPQYSAGNHGHDGGGDGRDPRGLDPDTGEHGSLRSSTLQHHTFSELGSVGETQEKDATYQLHAEQQQLDQPLYALRYDMHVPTKEEWQHYLSFLQHYYG